MKADRRSSHDRHAPPVIRPVPPRPPLSRQQHWMLGSALVLLLIVLLVLAFAVRQWQVDVTSPTTMPETAPTEPTALVFSQTEIQDLSAPAALERSGTLVVGLEQPISRINPLYAVGPGEHDAAALIFEPLLTFDTQGRPRNILADAYSFDRDTRQMTFQLRDDHFFRDGRPVQASDVSFTYQLLLAKSYDGQLRGLCPGITDVTADPDDSQRVIFTLQDWVDEPDLAWFTVGILKADHYAVDLGRVFELGQTTPEPEGSGAYELTRQDDDLTSLSLRPGFAGPVTRIEFHTLPSAEIYPALQQQAIDVAYVAWDERHKERVNNLPAYTWQTASATSAYGLVNRMAEGAEQLKTVDRQNAVLAVLAGQAPSEEQLAALDELAADGLQGYTYRDIDEPSSQAHATDAEAAVSRLTDLGIPVKLIPTDWPELASRVLEGRYDLLILPLPADEALPAGSALLSPRLVAAALKANEPLPGLADANTWLAASRPYAVLVHRRLQNLELNPLARPLSAQPLSWTDRLEQVKIISREENG